MIIIKYETEEEAENIIADKEAAGYTLVAVSNITEGNFLGFQEPGYVQPEPEAPLAEQINILKNENTDLKLALAELAETSESDKIDMQLALAELADLIAGGDQVG